MQELSKVIELIRQSQGVRLDPYRLPLDDRKTFGLLRCGETIGVAGLDAGGMRNFLRTTKPETFDDLLAVIALYHPRLMEAGLMQRFVDATEGQSEVAVEHPQLMPFLADSRGVLIYREQIIRVLHEIFGLEQGEAEEFVQLAAKHDPEDVKAYSSPFIEGALQNGVDFEEAETLFELTVAFCPHAITKAEFIPSAQKSYAASFLKAYYPVEFMAGILSTNLPRGRAKNGLSAQSLTDSLRSQGFEVRDLPTDLDDPVIELVAECRRMGIEVLGPDINVSDPEFTIEGNSIRCGLLTVRGIGSADAKLITETRQAGGPFKSFSDFVGRRGPAIEPDVAEVLVKAGAFDSLERNRAKVLIELRTEPSSGSDTPLSTFELKNFERGVLGFYVTGHPIEDVLGKGHREWSHTSVEANAATHRQGVSVGGLPVHVRVGETIQRSANVHPATYARFVLEDVDGRIACVAWPEVYETHKELLDGKSIVIATGKLQKYSKDHATLDIEELADIGINSAADDESQR